MGRFFLNVRCKMKLFGQPIQMRTFSALVFYRFRGLLQALVERKQSHDFFAFSSDELFGWV